MKTQNPHFVGATRQRNSNNNQKESAAAFGVEETPSPSAPSSKPKKMMLSPVADKDAVADIDNAVAAQTELNRRNGSANGGTIIPREELQKLLKQ